MSFVFFDTETTGLRPGFDQIIRFAAIRTDTELNELARFEARARLLPHVLPHPAALLTNGLSIEDLTAPGLPSHLAMIGEIQRTLLAWSPAVFVGFNSIRFDEEILRHALFQCLYPAYLTSCHGNCRADALSLIMAADAVSPSQLVVPALQDGRRTFRLEALAAANGIAHQAHDAMSDALATLELCRLVAQRSSELFQRFFRFSNKAVVADFVDASEPFVLSEFFGGEAFHSTVVCIGSDPEQANVRICLNLAADCAAMASMNENELQSYLQQRPCPVRRFRVNAAPTLTATYDAAEHMLGNLTVEVANVRASQILSDRDFCARLTAGYVAARQRFPAPTSIEASLYRGFPELHDEERLRAFHAARWEERAAIVERIEDDRLRWFGHRLLYYRDRTALPNSSRAEIERHLLDRLFNGEIGSLTFEDALGETTRLLQLEANAPPILASYQTYLIERQARAANYRARLAA